MKIKRVFDLLLAIFLLGALSVPMLVIAFIVKISSKGPFLYRSDRIGVNNKIFKMSKFRTMRIDTPQLATHLLKNPDACLTPVGSFLRRFSLDELPQLFNILSGDMSFIGPRPALFNQSDLRRGVIFLKIVAILSLTIRNGWLLFNRIFSVYDKKENIDNELRSVKGLQNDINNLGIEVEKLKITKDNIRSINLIQEPRVSFRPVGQGKRQKVMLAGILSLMAGAFLAFFIEFLERSKRA